MGLEPSGRSPPPRSGNVRYGPKSRSCHILASHPNLSLQKRVISAFNPEDTRRPTSNPINNLAPEKARIDRRGFDRARAGVHCRA